MSDSLPEPKILNLPLAEGVQPYAGRKPVLLLVLDGWGLAPADHGNAVAQADTPNMDRLWQEYAHTMLGASGEYVGLPAGVDGNSETGHMNIGAGRVVWQSLSRIDRSIEDGSFFQNQVFLGAIKHAKENNSKLHLIGLLGDGYVHSSNQHLLALLNLAEQQQFNDVFVHAFTDGRDSPPEDGLPRLQKIEQEMQRLGVGQFATITGRFYGMDRDRNWERTQQAYDAIVLGQGEQVTDWQTALQRSYAQRITDEFVEPILITDANGQPTMIEDHDAVIFFNFRVDRPRQLSWALVLPDFEYRDLSGSSSGQQVDFSQIDQSKIVNFQRARVPQSLYFATMTDYDQDLPVPKAFPRQDIDGNLGEVLSQAGVRQLRLAETEKEKMVTYYIDGKREDPYPGENWVILPSKKVRSYAEIPEMTAVEITEELVKQINQGSFDAAIVNLANGDMVGHTGDLQAGIKACEIVDQQIGKIVEATLAAGGVLIITADHGNAEEMITPKTGGIDTEHSTAPVPLIIVGQDFADGSQLTTGVLGDVAPTMLRLMNLNQPPAMTGKSLI